METNPYEYDSYNKSVPWIPQQNQLYEGWYTPGRTGQQGPPVPQNSRPQQRSVDQRPKAPGRMPKERALALARTFKKWLVAASLVGFVSLSGLVASHQVGATATSNSSGSSQKTTPATQSSSQNSNGFFNSQGGNNFGSNNSSNGSTSGSSNSSNGSGSSSQAPVSGSSVS